MQPQGGAHLRGVNSQQLQLPSGLPRWTHQAKAIAQQHQLDLNDHHNHNDHDYNRGANHSHTGASDNGKPRQSGGSV